MRKLSYLWIVVIVLATLSDLRGQEKAETGKLYTDEFVKALLPGRTLLLNGTFAQLVEANTLIKLEGSVPSQEICKRVQIDENRLEFIEGNGYMNSTTLRARISPGFDLLFYGGGAWDEPADFFQLAIMPHVKADYLTTLFRVGLGIQNGQLLDKKGEVVEPETHQLNR